MMVGMMIHPGRSSSAHDHFLFAHIPHVSLLSLMFVVGKLDNQRSRRSFHDNVVVVQVFNRLHGGFSLGKS